MVFSTTARLYNHHHYLITEHFHHIPKRCYTFSQAFPIPFYPQTLATINLLSISMDLSILAEWNHTLFIFCVRLLLLSIMFSNFLHVVEYHCFISFYGSIIFYCMDIPLCVSTHYLLHIWTVPLLMVMNNN